VLGRTSVVINTSRLALISAATKACTFREVSLLQSAAETGHSSGRQGVGGREWEAGSGRQGVGAEERARCRVVEQLTRSSGGIA